MNEVLVEEYRGGLLENVHEGHICGVSEAGDGSGNQANASC
ncbi:hypothetical protein [Paenibacillus sp. N3.4]|nr:hypothetical protein [Paenibacillus sp. N3.4]